MKNYEKDFGELVDSFINGNRTFFASKVLKFQKRKLVSFFFYLHNNEDWIGKETCSDIIFKLNARVNDKSVPVG